MFIQKKLSLIISMKKLIFFFAFMFISCSGNDDNIGDCFVSPDLDRACTEEYQPVCACNGLVYGNSCKAEREGNLKWKSTNKDVGEECNF